jgi:CheY-like chemotaxis protein
VVDDEPDAAAALALALEGCGAEVATRLNAAEALEILRTRQVYVLLADIGIPGMDGYEMIRRIRTSEPVQRWPRVAIAVTAYAGPSVRTRVSEAGFDAHLQKPVPPDRIIAIVVQTLTARDAHVRS